MILNAPKADLFIFYPPGARGDFLASVIKDEFYLYYQNYTMTAPKGYQKSHWVNEIAKHGISAHYRTRIRIRLNTLDDFLTVLHLWEEKLPVWASQEELLALLIKDELIARTFTSLFTHIVDFSNLFDVEFIDKLYREINGKPMSDTTKAQIKHNLSLQPRATISYKP